MTFAAPIPDREREAVVAPAHELPSLELLAEPPMVENDPGAIMLTCANCGAGMIERKCKLICTCGYFLSCSDYY